MIWKEKIENKMQSNGVFENCDIYETEKIRVKYMAEELNEYEKEIEELKQKLEDAESRISC